MVALLALVIVCARASSASAQPTLASPVNGASFARNASISFTVNVPAGTVTTAIQLSTSPATNANGSLASPLPTFYGAALGSPATYTWQPVDQAPGTFYWQATAFVCDATTLSCPGDEVSAVQSIVLTPAPAPAPVSPASGAVETAGQPVQVVFTPNPEDEDTKLFVVFSSSAAVGADGVLGDPAATTGDLSSEEGADTNTNVSAPIPAAIDTPGTIYWQAVRVNCVDNPTSPCDVPGAVSKLVLKAPPLRVAVGGSTTVFHIGHPRVLWTISCNDACSGTMHAVAAVPRGHGFVADGLFDLGPEKFSLGAGQTRTWGYTYSGSKLQQLARAVKLHGSVRLEIVVVARSAQGGGTATASRTVAIRPNPPPAPPPPPPGPDANLSFAGDGTENLGPITVPVNSYLDWTCAGVGCSFGVDSDPNAAGNVIATSGQGSGQTYVDAGTYNNVNVLAIGSWTITFTAAG
jgi:hypothetical protein